MSAMFAALRRGLSFRVEDSTEGVFTTSPIGLLSSFVLTLIGNKCFTLHTSCLIRQGLLSLFATLKIADLTRPSLPGSSSTFASFQNIRLDELFFKITMLPRAISGLLQTLDFRALFSRRVQQVRLSPLDGKLMEKMTVVLHFSG